MPRLRGDNSGPDSVILLDTLSISRCDLRAEKSSRVVGRSKVFLLSGLQPTNLAYLQIRTQTLNVNNSTKLTLTRENYKLSNVIMWAFIFGAVFYTFAHKTKSSEQMKKSFCLKHHVDT